MAMSDFRLKRAPVSAPASAEELSWLEAAAAGCLTGYRKFKEVLKHPDSSTYAGENVAL